MNIRDQGSGIRDQGICCGRAAPVQQPARSADKSLITDSCPLIPERGFTLIELAIVVCIVGLLAATLLTRVWFYQDQAEKAAMEQVAGALQSSLTMKYARLLTRGKESDIKTLVAENPMKWLAKVPPNYAGEYYDMSPRTVAPGNWAFDLKSRQLIYVVDRGDYFKPDKDGQKWIRFHVNLLYEAAEGTGASGKELVGVLFEPTEPYRWFK